MMNIEVAREFINEHKDEVIDLFITYQIMEMELCLKLHLPGLDEMDGREVALEAVNKEINSKTFGRLTRQYLEKYPDDKYDIKLDLETVGMQRNSFMHSIWVIVALGQKKEKVAEMGEVLLKDFTKNANRLFDKLNALPAEKTKM